MTKAKRSSSTAIVESLPKRLAVDPDLAKLASVAAAIKKSELVDSMKELLCGGIKVSLGIYKDKRQPFQTFTVDEISEVLKGVKSKLETTVVEAQKNLDIAVASKTERESALAAAQERVRKLEEDVSERESALGAATESLDKGIAPLTEASAAQLKCEADSSRATSQKNVLMTAMGTFMSVKERAATAPEVKSLLATGKQFSFENNMLVTAQNALKKDLGERKEFDNLVISQFEAEFFKQTAKVSTIIEEAEAAKIQHEAAIIAAKASQDVAMATLDACNNAFEDAKEALITGLSSRDAAQKALSNYLPDLKVAAGALDEAQAALDRFVSVPYAAFLELRDRETPEAKVSAHEVNQRVEEIFSASKVQTNETPTSLPCEAGA